MRIAFLQREWFENIGLMVLAGVLEDGGHRVEIFIDSAEKDILSAVAAYAPDMACFSCTTGEHLWALATAARLKERRALLTVFGGHHPTFFPKIVENPAVDIICRGEGEEALKELAQALERGLPVENIRNLWVKKDGRVIQNDLRPLIENLDTLPIPSRKIYDKYPALQQGPTKHFIASRGCPCRCSYCYAHALRTLYQGKGTFVRFRSPGHVIGEIRQTKERYVLRTVFLDDDILTFNKEWLYAFLEEYRREINVPFICNVWAADLDGETCRRLAEAGCFRVSMGVETGDEDLRRRVLHKNISDEQIVTAAANLRRHGIRILTNNMIGLPGETIAQAFKTVALNVRIRADYPWCSLLQPYPNTDIERYAAEAGLIEPRTNQSFESTFFKSTPLKQDNIRPLVRLQKFFFLAVKCPVLIPLIKILIRLPLTPLYEFIFLVTFAHRYQVANRLTFGEMMEFCRRNLLLYKKHA